MAVDRDHVTQKVQLLMKKGRWDKALDEMKKLHAEDKSDPMITLRMGDLHLKAGDGKKAALSYYKTAGLFEAEGQTAKAIATYKMILRIDPDYEDVDERLEKLAREKIISPAPGSIGASAGGKAADVIELSGPAKSDAATVQGSYADMPGDGAEESSGGYGGIEFGDTAVIDEGLVGGSGMERVVESVSDDAAPLPATGQPIPLFAEMPREELWGLLGRMKRRSFEDGESIVSEGEQGDSLYIVKRGGASVVTRINGVWVRLAKLGERDFFGEVSFLTGRPRTADIVASGPTEVLELSGHELKKVIEKYPSVEGTLRMFHESRVGDTLTTVKAVPKELLL